MSRNGNIILDRYNPESPSAIEFRRLYSRLKYKLEGKKISPLMVTSAKHEEGKTTTAAFLAITIAHQEDGRVLLVDMDLHRPRIHRMYGVPLPGGVTELIQGIATLESAAKKTGLPNLDVLTSGRMVRSPSALFEADNLSNLFESLGQSYDVIVIDTPPLLPVSDTMILSTQVAAVLFVIMAGKTPRDVIVRGKEILSDVNAPLAGVVINNSKDVLPYYYRYKYYGYRQKGD